MLYHSIVVAFKDSPLFKDPKHSYFNWIGEFVLPIVAKIKPEKYWFTPYGDYARLRLWVDEAKTDELNKAIDGQLSTLQLVRMSESDLRKYERAPDGSPGRDDVYAEHDLTLPQDLAPRSKDKNGKDNDRFCPAAFNDEQRIERAIQILSVLHSTCELLIGTLSHGNDGNWIMELNENDKENPEGSIFQSVHHLFCLITKVPTPVKVFKLKGVEYVGSNYQMWMSARDVGEAPDFVDNLDIRY